MGGLVTKTGKFFTGMSPVAHADANFDSVFPYEVVLPETVTKTLRSSYLRTSYLHSNAAAITSGTIIHRENGGGAITHTEDNTDLDAYRGTLFAESTTTDFTIDGTIAKSVYPMVTALRGNLAGEELTFDAEHVVTYDADFTQDAPSLGTGKSQILAQMTNVQNMSGYSLQLYVSANFH